MRKGRAMRKYYRGAVHRPKSGPLGSTIGNAHWEPKGGRMLEQILAEADMRMYEEESSEKPRCYHLAPPVWFRFPQKSPLLSGFYELHGRSASPRNSP